MHVSHNFIYNNIGAEQDGIRGRLCGGVTKMDGVFSSRGTPGPASGNFRRSLPEKNMY